MNANGWQSRIMHQVVVQQSFVFQFPMILIMGVKLGDFFFGRLVIKNLLLSIGTWLRFNVYQAPNACIPNQPQDRATVKDYFIYII
jgi:hypothetical protein